MVKIKDKELRALGDRVFVRLEPEKNQSENGIILPEASVNERNCGEVVSIGSDVGLVKSGDRVLFHIFDELPSPDPDIVVVRENSILGIWEDEK